MLEEKLTALKKELIEYANFVQNMFDKSIKGLQKKDEASLQDIISKDEPRANREEIQLDKLCTVLIAQYEPRASDLRTVLMILKINNDLERMADHVINITESSLFLIERPSMGILDDVITMSGLTGKMLKNSVDSFVSKDVEKARLVCRTDKQVNELRDRIVEKLISLMSADSHNIERALHLMRITTNLERISDLTTNICEDVIFMVEGQVIKHHHEQGE
ncbi:phosphate signaling complex protein PhoU [bacterium]|jgi:phosphate transport system protein|nr:phosphate signaling complex protein PhoU [bacterium]